MSMLFGVDCLVSSKVCPSSIDESESLILPSSSSSTSTMVWTRVLYRSPSPKSEGVDVAEVLGESGGVGCSSGLIGRGVAGSLRLRLSGIATCRGEFRRFPVTGCVIPQPGGPSLLTSGSSSVRGCLGNKGVVRLGVIETMRGGGDDDATGSCDDDATGEGVLLIGTGGWYCSIDEYSRRCNPQGAKGSGGVIARGDLTSGGLGGVGVNGGANGNGSIKGGSGATVGGGGCSFGMVIDVPCEGLGVGMNMGGGNLLPVILLRPLRSF